ncbi:putative uncharacterized protein DDB_G0290521 [Macrobrachium rosenbergii]|uniref:putative uncharacterized protein DDB_G0290521 n=1 Tax=Macrobrachium rosenbergii TaxID=79674 RepID=UPI0034D47C61
MEDLKREIQSMNFPKFIPECFLGPVREDPGEEDPVSPSPSAAASEDDPVPSSPPAAEWETDSSAAERHQGPEMNRKVGEPHEESHCHFQGTHPNPRFPWCTKVYSPWCTNLSPYDASSARDMATTAAAAQQRRATPQQYPPSRPWKQRRTPRRNVDYTPKPRETVPPPSLPSDTNTPPPSKPESLPSFTSATHPSPSSSDVPASASRESATTCSDSCITVTIEGIIILFEKLTGNLSTEEHCWNA